MTFGRKIGAGYVGVILLQALVGATAYVTNVGLLESSRLTTHTYEVLASLNGMVSMFKDAETGQRGFVITDREEYLAPYTAAMTAIRPELERLQKLTLDNPAQQDNLRALAPLVDEKLGVLARTTAARRGAEGFDAAQKLILTDEGRQLMVDIRALADKMIAEEQRLLALRTAAAQASADRLTVVIVGGFLVALVLSLGLAFVLSGALSRQIGTAVQHITSSAAELQAAANQQASGLREQVSAMAEITTTTKELLSTSRQIAESAQRVVRIAEETSSSARGGDQVVQKAQGSIDAIKRQVDQVVTSMLELGRRSQQIGGVLELVNELLEQTNILAINATIEAAGAGEGGRRFGAVAEEIRKLSDRVGASAREVRGLVDEIRASVSATVMATEGGAKAVDAGTRQFGEVTSSLGTITSRVGATTDAAREIELSTKQQTSAVEQVNAAIANVSQASRESEASATQTLQTAAELSNLSRDLSRMVDPAS